MVIESTISRKEFLRHALSRHFRRPGFYLYAFVAATLTAYGFFAPNAPTILYLAAWLPLLVYGAAGWIAITRRSRDTSLPIYLPTRYEFDKRGVEMSSRQGRNTFAWDEFRNWRKAEGVYELTLRSGQLLIISQRALSPRQAAALEDLLKKQITPRPEPGVFDT
ncbi:MAG: YcxB family protein [Chloroflexaceae bacterium]